LTISSAVAAAAAAGVALQAARQQIKENSAGDSQQDHRAIERNVIQPKHMRPQRAIDDLQDGNRRGVSRQRQDSRMESLDPAQINPAIRYRSVGQRASGQKYGCEPQQRY
jgi:hypothetical protein